ncbi:hypothetical protein [Mucilaginibacter sp.]|jgi:hypothetical protein|uniref:hypothetical protein n=1 Tax=Mucilaginibacter sp. TaxID=1882438 RepID=UPI00260365B9|nr:hypothetical protein [Mucilaginibacter sp.]MDB4926629.1 hypothetical protein [Mucilaginibacter sp.]
MFEDNAVFEIDYEGKAVRVSEHYIGEQRVFNVDLPLRGKALILTVTEGPKGKFWTSVPQGRQADAEKVGPLIAWYFKDKKNKA